MTTATHLALAGKETDDLRPYRAVHDYIDRHFHEYLDEIRRFLRNPGISASGEGMGRSANMALDYVKMLGSDAQICETKGWPIVFGRLNSKNPNAKTIIGYSLYDEVPAWPDEWESPPFDAELIDPTRIDVPGHVGSVICSRGTSNQRAPFLAFILTLKALQEATGDIPVNVIWLWEGEEEIGSPNLRPFVEAHYDDFRDAGAFYVPSFRQNWLGPMVLNRGYRGMVLLELECKGGGWGGTLDGHHLGPGGHVLWVDAPVMRLIKAIGSLYDENQDVAIDGYEESILPTSPEDLADMAEIERRFTPEVEEMYKQLLGIARFKGGKSGRDLFLHYLMAPSINVDGIVGGYGGPRHFTNLPQSVTAKFEFRLVPGLTPEIVVKLLRAHLDRRGFKEIEIKDATGYEPCRTSASDPIMTAAARSAEMHGVRSFVWPTVNGACPGTLFNKPPLNLPVCFAGLGHSGKSHMANEYAEVEGIRRNMKYVVTFLNEWAKL